MGDVFRLGASTGVAQLLTYSLTPWLTRVYAPVEFGEWAVFFAALTTIGSVASWRYELAVVLPRSERTAIALLFWSVGLAGTMGGVAYLTWEGLRSVFGMQLLPVGAWLAVAVILRGLQLNAIAWLNRKGAFGGIAFVNALLPIATIGGQLFAGVVLRLGAEGLVAGTLLGQMVAAAAATGSAVRHGLGGIRISRGRIRAAARIYRAYPRYMLPYTLAGELRNRLAVFLFSSMGATATVGSLAFADRLVRVPVSMASAAMRPVFYHAAAREGLAPVERTVQRALRLLSVITLPCFSILMYKGPSIFAVVFGHSWREAGTFAGVLAVPAFLMLLANWLDRGLDVMGRQRLAMEMEVAFSVVATAALAAALWVTGSIWIAIISHSVAVSAYYACWLVVFFRLAGYQIRPVVNDLLRGGLYAVLLLGGLSLAGRLGAGVSAVTVLAAGVAAMLGEIRGLRGAE